ncbi:histidine phosphatase family protein [candidate division KSB1 bacterium]|nr:histidine phosphatase family protein [candidate division KSB1 bacterium]
MMTLYFIRHAESEANKKNILASQMDYPLSKKGMEDARHIAEKFSVDNRVDKIISSPLIRAVQTAQPFSDIFNVDIKTNSNLLEQHLGRFSGMTYQDVESEPHYEHDKTKRWNWEPEGGGESYRMISDRLKIFFDSLDHEGNDKNILVVSHAVTLRIIRALLENTIPKYPVVLAKNGEVWKTEFQGLLNAHVIQSFHYI